MLNHSVLMGRIGQELTLKNTPSGAEVVSFSLAVQRDYNKDVTDWINIVAWKGTATTIAKHFKKGDLICIEGSIQTSNYEDKNGNKVYKVEVIASKVHFINGKSEPNATPSNTTTTVNTADVTPMVDDFVLLPADDDDLPFPL